MRPSSIQDNLAIIMLAAFLLVSQTACFPKIQPQDAAGASGEARGGALPTGAEAAGLLEDKATFIALDPQTFQVKLREELVWNAALAVLMRNYNINIVDRGNGLLTTEWDSFYLGRQVYRNKVSLRIAKLNYRSCQVTITNNTEVLRDGSAAATGAIGAIWLPAEDAAGESHRLIRNIASFLHEAPPRLPVAPPPPQEKGQAPASYDNPQKSL